MPVCCHYIPDPGLGRGNREDGLLGLLLRGTVPAPPRRCRAELSRPAAQDMLTPAPGRRAPSGALEGREYALLLLRRRRRLRRQGPGNRNGDGRLVRVAELPLRPGGA
ncbi:hypothetical protein PG994_012710 [Apiospora phragmitis]|uniref:Uncharacterized protein n=1 Tax=Apiospora phragmitis TaxID=2905665 RepID=A0ABR1TB94_9PEZI